MNASNVSIQNLEPNRRAQRPVDSPLETGKSSTPSKPFGPFARMTLLAGLALWNLAIDARAAQAPVSLGTAGDFVILSKTGISTVPTSTVTGDIGVSPIDSTAITGFSLILPAGGAFASSAQLTGRAYAPDYASPTPANLTTAVSNMETAYTDAAGRTLPDFTELGSGNIGGKTLVPGLYKWGTGVSIPTDVTFSGGVNEVWILQVAGGLTQAGATRVNLAGGAQAKNIFWQVAGLVSIGTTAHIEGIILAQTSITLNSGATAIGRLLSQTAVNISASTVTNPPIAPAAPSASTLAAGNDTGSSSSDNITSITTPSFTGTAVAGSTVRLYSDNPAANTLVGTGTATGGNYSIAVSTLASGTHNITAKASDSSGNTSAASAAFGITIDAVAPAISAIANQTINEDGTTGALAFTVSDAVAAAGSLTVTGSSNDTSLIPNSGIVLVGNDASRTVTLTPLANAFGLATITLSTVDSAGNSATRTFSVTVTAVNDRPSFIRGANQTVQENSGAQAVANWSTSISAGPSNEAAQALTFVLSNDSASLFSVQPAISSSGTLTYTLAPNASGSAAITLSLTDSGGTSAGGIDTSATQSFTIAVSSVNHEPTLAILADLTIEEGSTLRFTAVARDSDGDPLGFSLDASAPSGASINASTGEFTWTPSEAQGSMTYPITVRVKDPSNYQAMRTFRVTVTEVNQAPVLALIPDQTVSAGTTVRLFLPASDSDNPANRLTFSLVSGAPPGASLDVSTGEFSWTPNLSEAGNSYLIVARVSDDGQPSMSASQSFRVVVRPGANTAPILANVQPQFVAQGGLLLVANTAVDRDIPVQQLTWSLLPGSPAGMTVDVASGRISWSPQNAGSFTATVQVSDNGVPSMNATRTFDITVASSQNAQPTLDVIADHILIKNAAEQQIEVSGVSAGQGESQPITMSAITSNPGLIPSLSVNYTSPNATGTIVYRTAANTSGKAIVTVIVRDDLGGEITRSFNIQVPDDTEPTALLFLQHADGSFGRWQMHAEQLRNANYIEPAKPAEGNWNIVASGDFNRDGEKDLMLQEASGTLAVWFLKGVVSHEGLLLNPSQTGDSNWRVVSAADMNGDGSTDVIFQHADGTLAAWLMNGVNLTEARLLDPSAPGTTGWRALASGDLDNDGKADLVFQHTDGTLAAWLMDGIKMKQGVLIEPRTPSTSLWRVASVTDLDSDGKADLVFQHVDESMEVWFMDGVRRREHRPLNPPRPGAGWRIVTQ